MGKRMWAGSPGSVWGRLWGVVLTVGLVQVAAAAELTFGGDERVLVVAPHPDDETIATGGVIRHLTTTKLPVYVVFLTYGDGWDWAVRLANGGRPPTDADYVAFGRRRHQEATNAAGALELPLNALFFLGFPDDGMAALWDRGWTGKPVPSPHTGAQMVPYSDALAAGAPYTGEAVVQSLVRVLRVVRPSMIFVPHPADANPDHAIAPRFVAAALAALRGQHILPAKVHRFTYLVHHADWPASDALPGPMVAPTPGQIPATRWLQWPLSEAEQAAKARALEQYPSQLAASPALLRNFLRSTELFGRLQSKVWAAFAHAH